MLSRDPRAVLRPLSVLLVLPLALAASGCGDDDDPPGGTGGRTLSVPLDNEFGPLTLVQALEMALPGDSVLVQAGYAETLAGTVVIESGQTPFYLGGAKTRPVITAPLAGGAGLRFQNPKAGTRVELIEFRGGNAAVQAEGGMLEVGGCEFERGAVHVRGRSGAMLSVWECIMDRPTVFGIEMDGSSGVATQNTIWRAGDCGIYLVNGARLTVDKNLIAESHNWGIACRNAGQVGPGGLCNDVVASGVAGYSDCTPAETDFSLDPMLCDPAQGDFRVDVRSPCAPQNVEGSECAVSGNPELGVGALGVGCSPSDE